MILRGKQTLKARLAAGEVLFGTFYKFNSPHLVEMLGFAGFDFLLVDAEHSTYGYVEMQDAVRAANGVGMDAVVRVPSALPEHILHTCDLGAQGVQVPSLKTIPEVEAVLDSMRFFPLGHRGFGLTTRAARYSFCDSEEFMEYSNRELLSVIMVEQLEMVDRLDELCGVPGVDVLFIGPGDLSQALGVPGKMDDPRVLEVSEKIARTAVKNGKIAGMFCGGLKDVERALEWGVQYIAFSSELSMIAAKFKETMTSLHALRDGRR